LATDEFGIAVYSASASATIFLIKPKGAAKCPIENKKPICCLAVGFKLFFVFYLFNLRKVCAENAILFLLL